MLIDILKKQTEFGILFGLNVNWPNVINHLKLGFRWWTIQNKQFGY